MDLKNQLKKEFLTTDTKLMLQKLLRVFASNPNQHNSAFLLLKRLEKLNTKELRGTLSTEYGELASNKIEESILELIDTITDETALAYELENSIFQRMLIVCRTMEREAYMKNIFPGKFYKEIQVVVGQDKPPLEEVNGFDLVIYDNFADQEDPAQELLKFYLTQTEPYILYFGPPLPLLRQFPEKVYFANSVFSIHARVREMIEYLKYKKAYY